MLRTNGEGHVRDAGGKMSERERSLENRAVHDKDEQLLRKLRETLKLKDDEKIPDEVADKLQDAVKTAKKEKEKEKEKQKEKEKKAK